MGPYFWLQCVNRPELTFAVVPMAVIRPGYELSLGAAERERFAWAGRGGAGGALAGAPVSGRKLYLREKLSFLMLFGLMTFPYLYFLWQVKDFGNTADLVYGELLSIVLYAPLIMAAPQVGILLAFGVQSVIAFIEFFYIHYYGALPGVSFLYVLVESDPNEAHGFVTDYFRSLPVLGFWAAAAVGFWLLSRLTRQLNAKAVRLFVCIFAIVLLIPMFLQSTRQRIPRGNFLVKCAISYRDYRMVHEESRQAAAAAMAHTPPLRFAFERPEKEIHVLIIGESADRDHMSLYGFGLETTPRLAAMRDELYPVLDERMQMFQDDHPAP